MTTVLPPMLFTVIFSLAFTWIWNFDMKFLNPSDTSNGLSSWAKCFTSYKFSINIRPAISAASKSLSNLLLAAIINFLCRLIAKKDFVKSFVQSKSYFNPHTLPKMLSSCDVHLPCINSVLLSFFDSRCIFIFLIILMINFFCEHIRYTDSCWFLVMHVKWFNSGVLYIWLTHL